MNTHRILKSVTLESEHKLPQNNPSFTLHTVQTFNMIHAFGHFKYYHHQSNPFSTLFTSFNLLIEGTPPTIVGLVASMASSTSLSYAEWSCALGLWPETTPNSPLLISASLFARLSTNLLTSWSLTHRMSLSPSGSTFSISPC